MKNISKIKKIKLLLLYILLINSLQLFSQNNYQLFVGNSLPNNISNKYLKPGIYLGYGIDFKLSNHFFLNTDISISYNNRNNSYRFGFDDNPFLEANLDKKERYENQSFYNDNTLTLFLFNPSIGLNFKYFIFPEKKITLYLLAGISGIYSILKDQYEVWEFNDIGTWKVHYVEGGNLEQQLNIGFQAGIGLNYNLKNNKSIFIESQYKLQPYVKFGINNDRVGLFIINAGITFPFSKKN